MTQDAGAVADALLGEFRTLPAILSAGARAHARVLPREPGVVTLLAHVRETLVEALRISLSEAPVLGNMKALTDYLRVAMAHDHHERVRVLFLDSHNALIRDEVISYGDTLTASVSPRDIMRRALELGASALVLAHNHPSGDPTPSAADVRITRAVAEAGRTLDIVLHDHIIVSTQGWTSMTREGLIEPAFPGAA